MFVYNLISSIAFFDPVQVSSALGMRDAQLAFLEQKLREDVERELEDIMELEQHLHHNMNLVQEKKRQLEIKKREPIQCLVNIVSCWKRK